MVKWINLNFSHEPITAALALHRQTTRWYLGRMIIYTDSVEYADNVLTPVKAWRPIRQPQVEEILQAAAGRLFTTDELYRSNADIPGCWKYGFLVRQAPASQYDIVIDMHQQRQELPAGFVCLAESGRNFHGQRGRAWSTLPGNIHLTASLSPRRRIDKFHIGFSLLTAVSVIDAIDSLPSLAGKAQIKWVNDVLIEGKKVAGFLANTSSSGDTVSAAVLGIGLNVETAPRIAGDEVMPATASLRYFVADREQCRQKRILRRLLLDLDKNYRLLLSGRCDRLLDTYRERSAVIGRRVRIVSDAPGKQEVEMAAGKVLGIGENLELLLEGVTEPMTRGRLILLD
jgi:biotin-[acetyl-CoA-carboxylase] ligase BirA-like protein